MCMHECACVFKCVWMYMCVHVCECACVNSRVCMSVTVCVDLKTFPEVLYSVFFSWVTLPLLLLFISTIGASHLLCWTGSQGPPRLGLRLVLVCGWDTHMLGTVFTESSGAEVSDSGVPRAASSLQGSLWN